MDWQAGMLWAKFKFRRTIWSLSKRTGNVPMPTKLTAYSAQDKNIVFSRIRMKSRNLWLLDCIHPLKSRILFRCTMHICIDANANFYWKRYDTVTLFSIATMFFYIKGNTSDGTVACLNSRYILLYFVTFGRRGHKFPPNVSLFWEIRGPLCDLDNNFPFHVSLFPWYASS